MCVKEPVGKKSWKKKMLSPSLFMLLQLHVSASCSGQENNIVYKKTKNKKHSQFFTEDPKAYSKATNGLQKSSDLNLPLCLFVSLSFPKKTHHFSFFFPPTGQP